MKKKSITRNYIYNLTYQILTLLLPLITAPYISRVLGAENIGIYSFTLSISSYFILFGSLGISLYGQREIAYQQGKKKETSKIFWEITVLRWITMTFSMIFFYFTFIMKSNEYNIYYKILLLEILGNSLDISWFFQGLEEFKKTVTRNMVVKLISLICIFIFVKTSNELRNYFYIYVMSILIGNGSLWLYLPQYLCKIRIKELKILKHFKPTISLFIPQIAIQIYTILDKTMIGTIIQDKAEVGFYEQSQKIVKMTLTVITSLGTVMLPRIANCYGQGDKKKILEYMNKSFRMAFFLAIPMTVGICVIADTFVPIFFGNGYDKVIILLKIISPIIIFIGLSNIIGNQYLLPTKKQKEFTISVCIGAVVNFILNACFIPKLGAIGAAIGTVVAEFTVMAVQMYLVRNIFDIKEILKFSKNYLIASLLMFIVCNIAKKMIDSYYISTILQVILGIVSYMICLGLLRDEIMYEGIKKIKEKIYLSK